VKRYSVVIKEGSWLARIAAAKLGSKSVAMVLGSTIHLHNTSKQEFLQNEKWLKHELCHVRQYKQQGYKLFILKYLWQSFKNGYYNNAFEAAARAAEEL
jgi:Domain of unknown function (DUF4157)